jgi:hypothetical protein
MILNYASLRFPLERLTQDEIEEIRATCAAKARRASNGAQKEVNKKVKAAVNKETP